MSRMEEREKANGGFGVVFYVPMYGESQGAKEVRCQKAGVLGQSEKDTSFTGEHLQAPVSRWRIECDSSAKISRTRL
jgi:hypothetical protein